MIKPLNDNILLQLIEDKADEVVTETGIILSKRIATSSTMRKAKVIAVYDECEIVQPGDIVYIPGLNLAAALIEVDGQEMYLVIEKTIVAKG